VARNEWISLDSAPPPQNSTEGKTHILRVSKARAPWLKNRGLKNREQNNASALTLAQLDLQQFGNDCTLLKKYEILKGMIHALFLYFFILPTFANPTPTPSPTPDAVAEKFARLEATLLPEVEIVRCRKGRAPCFENDARYGCVDESLAPEAFKLACDEYIKTIERQYSFACKVVADGTEVFLGMVSDSEACDILTIAWKEFQKDPRYTGFSTEMKVAKLRTILKPNGKKGAPIFGSDIRFRKNGKAKREKLNTRQIEKAMRDRMREYDEEITCGPGIVKGIDRVPILNQNQQGTCYSHVAANLTDFLRITRFKSSYPEFSSPLMMAIDHHVNTDKEIDTCIKPAWGGDTCETFNRAMKKGFCSTEEIEKAIARSYTPSGEGLDKRSNWYHNWSSKLIEGPDFQMEVMKFNNSDHLTQKMINDEKRALNQDNLVKFLYLLGQAYQKKDFNLIRELHTKVKNASPDSEEETCITSKSTDDPKLVSIMLASDLGRFYRDFFESLCDREKYPHPIYCKSTEGTPTQSVIERELYKGFPVGISYCANILHDAKYLKGTSPEACSNHASMIVGTARDKKGQCLYVVRNSWGTGCRNYDKSYTCKDGNIYIPKEKLIPNIYTTTSITAE
jgi:hypothetical protein